MADNENKPTTPSESPEKPLKNTQKAIREDYAKATPKQKLANFNVNPVTKQLERN